MWIWDPFHPHWFVPYIQTKSARKGQLHNTKLKWITNPLITPSSGPCVPLCREASGQFSLFYPSPPVLGRWSSSSFQELCPALPVWPRGPCLWGSLWLPTRSIQTAASSGRWSGKRTASHSTLALGLESSVGLRQKLENHMDVFWTFCLWLTWGYFDTDIAWSTRAQVSVSVCGFWCNQHGLCQQ